MIHISIRCDFCDEYYRGDGWFIFCLPGDILRVYGERRVTEYQRVWLDDHNVEFSYC